MYYDEDDEITTRIGPNGEMEYGIPLDRDVSAMVDFFADCLGVSFDEAANLLVRFGIESIKKDLPKTVQQMIDANNNSTKNDLSNFQIQKLRDKLD